MRVVTMSLFEGEFGTCCEDLSESLAVPQVSMFRVEDSGVLYLSIGYLEVEGGGTGWLDQAVIYCPFCGAQLQTREGIRACAGSS
jgi:hypothetical protein